MITSRFAEEDLMSKLLSDIDSRFKVTKSADRRNKNSGEDFSQADAANERVFMNALVIECKHDSATVNGLMSFNGAASSSYKIVLAMENHKWICKSIELRGISD